MTPSTPAGAQMLSERTDGRVSAIERKKDVAVMRGDTARSQGEITARSALDRAMTEAQLHEAITDYLDTHGWAYWHDNDSRRNEAGWPDIVAVKPPRCVAMELKTQRGWVRPEQRAWLNLLAQCGIETYIVRPRDWSAGVVEHVLTSDRARRAGEAEG